jgi:hypothetical protein
MFFTFLNKDDSNYLDLSILNNYNPEEVLFYFYNSSIRIALATCEEFKEKLDDAENLIDNHWMDIFEQIGLFADIITLKENDYLSILGPYYYPKFNVRFYLTEDNLSSQHINSDDLSVILALDAPIPANTELQNYYKTKKSNKKTAKTKNELVKDINMCMLSLKEIAGLNRHINYLNKLLEKRYAIVNKENLSIFEPDNLPEKPKKAEENEKNIGNLISFNVKNRYKKNHEKDHSNFNYKMKVYIIKYREYEKACDRYKKALENWDQTYSELLARCLKDIHDTEKKLKTALRNLDIYNGILRKSFIHSDYQDITTLGTFKYYLETGRANELAECMNLFEEERHWKEIKASQERIENTIYFIQNENENTRFADEHISEILNKTNKTPTALLKA